MNWAEVVAHPSLQDLPFKIELDQYGQIIMNPVKINHSFYRGKISSMLQQMREDGIVLVECAVKTKRGTKCADVAWLSIDLFEQIQNKTETEIAPEVCVEVISMSNSQKEMKQKRKLYFEQGAKEVWTCDEYGKMSFYDENGVLEKSIMFADFPVSVSYK